MSQFDSRTLDQEPDTVAIIEEYPEYVVVGTYSLVPAPEGEEDSASTNVGGGRKGSLQVLPFSSTLSTRSAISDSVSLPRKDFPFGIYDVHFHPQHKKLLGVATSDAEILFFDVSPQSSPSSSITDIRLAGVGKILIEEPHPDDQRSAIITQFHFLDISEHSLTSTKSEHYAIFLVATTQFGNTKLVQVTLQRDVEHGDHSRTLESQIIDIHKQAFDLEAWTTLPIFTSQSTLHILSGGDDSQLLISSIEMPSDETNSIENLDLDLLTPTKQFTDIRTHEAGVVHICNLGLHPSRLTLPTPDDDTANVPRYLILTGSYDENLRLFLFSPTNSSHPTTQLNLLSEINLGGGVWRIILLDTYDNSASLGCDYILLVAAHTAGACVVRLSCAAVDDGKWEYEFKVEKWFTEGHESLVYAIAAKREVTGERRWDVISASFYDKRICEWSWADETKRVLEVS